MKNMETKNCWYTQEYGGDKGIQEGVLISINGGQFYDGEMGTATTTYTVANIKTGELHSETKVWLKRLPGMTDDFQYPKLPEPTDLKF